MRQPEHFDYPRTTVRRVVDNAIRLDHAKLTNNVRRIALLSYGADLLDQQWTEERSASLPHLFESFRAAFGSSSTTKAA